jgi:hypothetical protein
MIIFQQIWCCSNNYSDREKTRECPSSTAIEIGFWQLNILLPKLGTTKSIGKIRYGSLILSYYGVSTWDRQNVLLWMLLSKEQDLQDDLNEMVDWVQNLEE